MPETARPQDPIRPIDVLAIVLLGAALGVLFNALEMVENPTRALAWVKSERTVVALASDPPAAAAKPAAGARPESTARVHVAPVPTPGRHAKAPHAAPPQASLARGTATHGPATSPVPEPPAPAAAVTGAPAIPDAREPREASLETVRALHTAGTAVFFDARSTEEYAAGHIAGAISMPFDEVFRDPSRVKSVAAGTRPIVTYCDGGDCDLSRNLAFSLIDAGYRKLLIFKGGMPAWKAAGAPVRTGSQP